MILQLPLEDVVELQLPLEDVVVVATFSAKVAGEVDLGII